MTCDSKINVSTAQRACAGNKAVSKNTLNDQNAKKSKTSQQRPLERRQTVTLEARLTGENKADKRTYHGQQQQKKEHTKKLHGLV
ncbi:MAG: hypothetical protein ACI9I0_001377 [Rhodoferax sp.]|jgi:hypothetical protein